MFFVLSFVFFILNRETPVTSEYSSIHTRDTKSSSNPPRPYSASQTAVRGVRDTASASKQECKDSDASEDTDRDRDRRGHNHSKASYQKDIENMDNKDKDKVNGKSSEGRGGIHQSSVMNEKPSLQQGYFSLPSLECSRSDSSFVTPSDGYFSSNQQSLASDMNSHDFGEESDILEEWEESSFGTGIGRFLYNPDRKWVSWFGH